MEVVVGGQSCLWCFLYRVKGFDFSLYIYFPFTFYFFGSFISVYDMYIVIKV